MNAWKKYDLRKENLKVVEDQGLPGFKLPGPEAWGALTKELASRLRLSEYSYDNDGNVIRQVQLTRV